MMFKGIHIYNQQLSSSLANISVVFADNSIEHSNGIMHIVVSDIVQRNMFNEFVDISLRRPYLRLVFVGDINYLTWKKVKGEEDCELCEIELKNGEEFAGTVVFMRGGFYKKNPNEYMSEQVRKYLGSLDTSKYETYNELIEKYMDNPWLRVILLNVNKLKFSPYFSPYSKQ